MALKLTDNIKDIFTPQDKPRKGLLAFETVVLIYLVLTTAFILFTYNQLNAPTAMLLMRAKALIITLALWGLYRLYPAPFSILLRAAACLMMLAWWYPDTYEINNIFPNLDHLFANIEQNIFHYQPALLFSQKINNPFFSELMYLGYASYFPLIALTAAYCFFCRRQQFQQAVFIIIASFFVYYVVFDLLPVVGPQYYYPAVGEDQIAQGILPNLHDYFHTHAERATSPGYGQGIFYQLVEQAHNTGERPTAAFPSSHVGITTILLLLAHRAKSKTLFYTILPFAILMLFATVYIQAHYAIDAIAGLITAPVIYVTVKNIKIK